MALLLNAPEDRGHAATAGWLRTVARRLFAKQGRLRRGLELASEDQLEAAWIAGEGAPGPSSGDDYADALDACMESLAPRARRALELRYGQDLTRSDMAAALDLSEEGVKTTLRRTRDTLQRCIEDRIQRASRRTS